MDKCTICDSTKTPYITYKDKRTGEVVCSSGHVIKSG